ncbi:MAG: ABC transporter ATP-binding protein [Planctomycetes bacterium]|nr:ABC transporter ATP-binding protein [Planctomycetota bacterium]
MPDSDSTLPLAFRSLSFEYRPERRVLTDIDLAVRPGELVTVIGPNGAGKSTLLLLGAGILAPSRGSADLYGDPAHGLPRREAARRTALVVELEPSEMGLTVAEILLQAAYPHQSAMALFPRDAEDSLAPVLRDLSLEHLASRPLAELSDGERKRCSFARALMQNVPLIMLDEPSSHLDFASQARMLDTLRRLKAQGKTLIVVEHDFLVSGRIADRIVLLSGGAVAAAGPPEEVLDRDRLSEVYGAELEVRGDGSCYHVALK